MKSEGGEDNASDCWRCVGSIGKDQKEYQGH